MSRVLKGYAIDEEKSRAQQQPSLAKWRACHEFETSDIGWAKLTQAGETNWSKRIMGDAKVVDVSTWRFKQGWDE